MATTTIAKNAVNTLKNAAGSAKLDTSNPFGFIVNRNTIQNALDSAANKAYDVKMREANLGLNRAEDTAYANTQNAVSELRRAMTGGVTNGANRGATGATMLQALLGLGQQNTGLVTEGLQNIQGVAGERAAALAQNAVTAIDQSNAARGQQATAANEKYTADQTRSAEALAALSALAGTTDTNVHNERMNKATNTANKAIANTTQRSQVTTYNR